jgi:hypothetical protein
MLSGAVSSEASVVIIIVASPVVATEQVSLTFRIREAQLSNLGSVAINPYIFFVVFLSISRHIPEWCFMLATTASLHIFSNGLFADHFIV